MKNHELFFINLFNKKNTTDIETNEPQLNNYYEERVENKKENEWFQEYELIYQSYGLEY